MSNENSIKSLRTGTVIVSGRIWCFRELVMKVVECEETTVQSRRVADFRYFSMFEGSEIWRMESTINNSKFKLKFPSFTSEFQSLNGRIQTMRLNGD